MRSLHDGAGPDLGNDVLLRDVRRVGLPVREGVNVGTCDVGARRAVRIREGLPRAARVGSWSRSDDDRTRQVAVESRNVLDNAEPASHILTRVACDAGSGGLELEFWQVRRNEMKDDREAHSRASDDQKPARTTSEEERHGSDRHHCGHEQRSILSEQNRRKRRDDQDGCEARGSTSRLDRGDADQQCDEEQKEEDELVRVRAECPADIVGISVS